MASVFSPSVLDIHNLVLAVTVMVLLLLTPLPCYQPKVAAGLFIRQAMKQSSSQNINDAEQIRLINMAPSRNPRIKRVANMVGMPDHLRLRFGGNKNSNGLISLQRVLGVDSMEMADYPVFQILKDGPERVDMPRDMIPQRAFYRQTNQTGLVMVSKTTSTSLGFTLDGTLTIGNKDYVISPHNQDTKGWQSDHVIKPFNTSVQGDKAMDEVLNADVAEEPLTFGQETRHNPIANIFRRGRRDKRYIELAMVADLAVFQRFMDYTGSKPLIALLEMYLYYGFVTLSASLRYETIHNHQTDIQVTVIPKSLYVCTFRRFCPWSENHVLDGSKIEFGKVLKAFRRYANSDKGPKGDHRMLFTGYRMARPDGKTGVIGVAYLGTGCSNWDVSIVQEFYTSVTSAITAHELGHGFSARHDTDDKSEGCSNSDFYVMAAYLAFPTSGGMATHPYSFSNCSARFIRDHLKSSKGDCTKNRPSFNMKTQFIAGQFYNADAQCAFAKGEGSVFCRTFQELRTFDQMCVRTFCSQPSSKPSRCVGIVPLHRTSCGNMKWCERGRCVASIDAPATPHDRCPQGDAPNIQCRQSLCTTDTYINILCCATCNGATPPTTSPPPPTTEYPPSCGKVCQCLLQTKTLFCFFKCVAGVPC